MGGRGGRPRRLPIPSITHVLAGSYSEVVFGQLHEPEKMSQQARLEWPVAMDRHRESRMGLLSLP